MIEMPKRNVTRFFIPMVDVMMLMFSIFLVMPIVESSVVEREKTRQESLELNRLSYNKLVRLAKMQRADLRQYGKVKKSAAQLAVEVKMLRKENQRLHRYADPKIRIEQLKKEIRQLEQDKIARLKERLFVRVLKIDPEKFHIYVDAPGSKKTVIESEKEAWDLIRKDKAAQEIAKGREIFYRVLLPGGDVFLPRSVTDKYKSWLRDVAHEIR